MNRYLCIVCFFVVISVEASAPPVPRKTVIVDAVCKTAKQETVVGGARLLGGRGEEKMPSVLAKDGANEHEYQLAELSRIVFESKVDPSGYRSATIHLKNGETKKLRLLASKKGHEIQLVGSTVVPLSVCKEITFREHEGDVTRTDGSTRPAVAN